MRAAILIGALGVCTGVLSAWLDINEKDGSGWGTLAAFLVIGACFEAIKGGKE